MEIFVALVAGLALVVFSKPFTRACRWWQEEVMKTEKYDLMVYRVPALLVGTIFILIAVLKWLK